MVEAKLRVETDIVVTKCLAGEKPRTIRYKTVTEETRVEEKPQNEDVAPCGIHVTLNIDRTIRTRTIRTLMSIRINRYYLEYEDYIETCEATRYHTFFEINSKTYEVAVLFKKDNSVKAIAVSEWILRGSYEDGEEADNIYFSDEPDMYYEEYYS